jgi:hypothetical protein
LLLLKQSNSVFQTSWLGLILCPLFAAFNGSRPAFRNRRLAGNLLLHIGILLSFVDSGCRFPWWRLVGVTARRRRDKRLLDEGWLGTARFEWRNWCCCGFVEGGNTIPE